MTGFVMFRADNGVLMLTDGCVYRSRNDFTITGFSGKVSTFPHLSMAIGSMGYTRLRFLIEFNCAQKWESFDHMLTVIKTDAEDALETLYQFEPDREQPVTTMMLMAGFSETNQRWQTHSMLIAEDEVEEPKEEVQLWFAPNPSDDAWRSQGFDIDTLHVSHFYADPEQDLQKILHAQRATPIEMTDDPKLLNDLACPKGHTVGGFIERVWITQSEATRRITHCWPDKIGEMIAS